MSYALLADVRAEGVPDDYTDARINDRIALATEYIHKRCGMYFEETDATLSFDGSGTGTLLLPMPLLSIDSITVSDTELTANDLTYVQNLSGNQPGDDQRRNPRLRWKGGRLWATGERNVEIEGSWGYVEGTSGSYTTPRAIRDLVIRLVILDLDLLADTAAQQEQRDARFGIRHAVHNRSVDLSDLAVSGGATGIPDIDNVLARFRRPMTAGIVRRQPRQ